MVFRADDVVKDVGRRIAEIREASGYTQDTFARTLKATPQYVSRLERGRNVTLHTLVRVANALKVSPQDLLAAPARRESRARGRPPKKKAT